jgi:Vitamin B12 dependent methionine synthase, activation domain
MSPAGNNPRRVTGSGKIPLTVEILPRLTIALRVPDILRSLGYPRDATPPAQVVRSTKRILIEARPWLQPRGTYSLYALTKLTAHSLEIGGATIKGDVGEFLHGAERVAVFMVTVGSEISRQAETRCRVGDAFAGLTLDAIGSWAAEAAAEALMKQLRSRLRPGESFTLRYSPGYCGMDLRQQRTLFKLAPAGSAGISLLPALLMQPLKSISGIVGLGPRKVVGIHLSPCERCPQVGCHMRR